MFVDRLFLLTVWSRRALTFSVTGRITLLFFLTCRSNAPASRPSNVCCQPRCLTLFIDVRCHFSRRSYWSTNRLSSAPKMNPVSISLRCFPFVILIQNPNKPALLRIFLHATEHDWMVNCLIVSWSAPVWKHLRSLCSPLIYLVVFINLLHVCISPVYPYFSLTYSTTPLH